LSPRAGFFQRLDTQLGQPRFGFGVLAQRQRLLLQARLGFTPRLFGSGRRFLLEPRRKALGLLAQTGQLLLLLLQRRFALLPAFLQRLLLLGVLLFGQTHVLVVLVLRLLAFQDLLVLVVLDLPLALLLEVFFQFLAFALAASGLLLPGGALRGDLGFQPLLLTRVVLDHLVEGGGRHVDLVQPLEFLALQRYGFARGRQQLGLLSQFPRDVRQSPADVQAQARNPLHDGLDGDRLHGLAYLGVPPAGRLFGFRVGRFARGFYLFLNLVEFLLHFRLGAPGAYRRFDRFRWHGNPPYETVA